MREDREGGEEGCEEKNKKTEGKSGKGKGPKGSTRLAYVGSSMQLAILRCPLSRVVIRRIFKVLLVAAPPLPFEPKQTECSVFFRQVARAREREGGRNGLCFRFQLEDQGMGVDGSERNAEVQWGKEREREREGQTNEKKGKRKGGKVLETTRGYYGVKRIFFQRFFSFLSFSFCPMRTRTRCNALQILYTLFKQVVRSIPFTLINLGKT